VKGEWLAYNVQIAQAGDYKLATRFAGGDSIIGIDFELDGGRQRLNLAVDNAQGIDVYQTTNVGVFNLSAGTHVIKVLVTAGSYGFNLDSMDLIADVVNPPGDGGGTDESNTPIDQSRLGVYVDQDGTIVADKAKFFPFGFYGENWRKPFSERMLGLKNIADAGFNTMLAEDISTDQFGELLDEASNRNVRVLVGSASLPDLGFIGARSINTRTNRRYLVGHYTMILTMAALHLPISVNAAILSNLKILHTSRFRR
jgi:hypothetical protein